MSSAITAPMMTITTIIAIAAYHTVFSVAKPLTGTGVDVVVATGELA